MKTINSGRLLKLSFNPLKPVVFILGLGPFLYIVYATITQNLGADPQKTILLKFGEWAFIFLLVTLSLSVAKRRIGFKSAIKYRRMLGLFVTFYASLHLLTYYVFYLGLSFTELSTEIIERPYLILGFLAWCLLVPLTLTSTKAAMRKLKKNWQKLHYAIYLIAILAWIHFFWQVKSDINEVVLYGIVLFGLLSERLFYHVKKLSKKSSVQMTKTSIN